VEVRVLQRQRALLEEGVGLGGLLAGGGLAVAGRGLGEGRRGHHAAEDGGQGKAERMLHVRYPGNGPIPKDSRCTWTGGHDQWQGAMAGAPFSFRRQRTMVTGMSPWAMTLLETEPSRMPFTAPRPCEPSTIRSVVSVFATARMVSATSPTSALPFSSSLARESERRASLSICSSDSSCSWRTAALPMRVSTPGKVGGSTASRVTFAGLASSRLRAMTNLTARKAMSLPSTATRIFIWGMSRLSKRKV